MKVTSCHSGRIAHRNDNFLREHRSKIGVVQTKASFVLRSSLSLFRWYQRR